MRNSLIENLKRKAEEEKEEKEVKENKKLKEEKEKQEEEGKQQEEEGKQQEEEGKQQEEEGKQQEEEGEQQEKKTWKQKQEEFNKKLGEMRKQIFELSGNYPCNLPIFKVVSKELINLPEINEKKIRKICSKILATIEITVGENTFSRTEYGERSMFTKKIEWIESENKKSMIDHTKYILYQKIITFFEAKN